MRVIFLILLLGSQFSFGLTLDDYLAQVKTGNSEARSLVQGVESAKLKLQQAEATLSSEFYAEYGFLDDKNEPPSPFGAARTQGTSWKAGVRDRTIFGLNSDVFVRSDHVSLLGVNRSFVPLDDYYDSSVGIQFRQSLWRNGFGQITRNEYRIQESANKMEYLRQKFELKNLLLRAENIYWSLVSYNQIVKLQEENVERSGKLRALMARRAGQRLVDDVDALQARAAFETRELELMFSNDERSALIRQFNTFRGIDSDRVESIVMDLPTDKMLLKISKDPSTRMTREDFSILYEQAMLSKSEATASKSKIAPQLDIVGGVSANGLDRKRSDSWSESQDLHNPTWTVGVQFSMGLDFGVLNDLRRGFKGQARASEDRAHYAKFSEQRAWDDILSQLKDSQNRFEKSLALEKTQTELVKRERQRFLNGRSTTFQSITIEQNLAFSQIQRIRAQLGLLQVYNLVRSFEVVQ